MRRARIDRNQVSIVTALRARGATVQHLHAVGEGVPDLLVGYRGATELVEVKDGERPPSERRLTTDQVRWHSTWRGRPVRVVHSEEEAVQVLVDIDHAVQRLEASC